MSGPTRVAVVGLGYWGPNLARNFASIPGCELAWLCDASDQALAKSSVHFPAARRTSDIEELLSDEQLDAVVLATPVPTHARLAVDVLEAGKHCLVEKPLATSAEDAKRAVDACERSGKQLMVGHLLEYHPAVQRSEGAWSWAVSSAELYYPYGNRSEPRQAPLR